VSFDNYSASYFDIVLVVGCEVLVALVMNSTISWNITACI
jgi:hypothetical protein